MKSRFLMLAAAVTLFAALAVPVGLVAQDKAQSCEDYFERALRLSADLKHRAEFRIRIGTLVNGKIRGEELFGAGGIARGERVGTLEGTANFHWVERRRNISCSPCPSGRITQRAKENATAMGIRVYRALTNRTHASAS